MLLEPRSFIKFGWRAASNSEGWALNAGLLEGMGASQVLALNNLGGGD